MCPGYSEVKQTEIWEFGERFIAGLSKENKWLMLKTLNSLMVCGERFLSADFGVRAAGCVALF